MTAAATPNPIDLKAELERAYAALERGALDEADAVAERIIATSPTVGDGYRLLARVQLLRGDLPGARATLGRGIAAAAEPLPLLMDQAEVAIKAEDGPGALAAALEARRIGGDQVRLVLLTGKARWCAGDRAAALADFALAAAHGTDITEVQIAYARALFGLDRADEAVAVLERTVARRPGGIASALLALATVDPDAPTRGLPAIEAALELTPKEPTLQLLRAMLLALGDDPRADAAAAAAVGADAHLRARWDMFQHLRGAGCAAFCGQPQQVVARAHAAARLDGAELAFGPQPELGALPEGALRLVQLDCRSAADTARVLATLGDGLRPGTVLLFRAYLGFPGAEAADFGAWQRFVAARSVGYAYVAGALLGSEVAVRIDAIEPGDDR